MCYLHLHPRQEVAKNSHKIATSNVVEDLHCWKKNNVHDMDMLLAANKQKNEYVEIYHFKKTSKLWPYARYNAAKSSRQCSFLKYQSFGCGFHYNQRKHVYAWKVTFCYLYGSASFSHTTTFQHCSGYSLLVSFLGCCQVVN